MTGMLSALQVMCVSSPTELESHLCCLPINSLVPPHTTHTCLPVRNRLGNKVGFLLDLFPTCSKDL